MSDIFLDKSTVDLIHNRVRLNVELIKTISSDYYDDIQKTIIEAVEQGYDLRKTENSIKSKTQASERKAKFWARDQVSKGMAEITRTRQLEAGFDGFIWRTMQDERVRDTHQNLNGKIFSWNIIGAEEELTEKWMRYPGDDYNCRCYAEPVNLDDADGRDRTE